MERRKTMDEWLAEGGEMMEFPLYDGTPFGQAKGAQIEAEAKYWAKLEQLNGDAERNMLRLSDALGPSFRDGATVAQALESVRKNEGEAAHARALNFCREAERLGREIQRLETQPQTFAP